MLKINKCMKNVNFKISDSTKKFLFAVALTFCVAGVYAQDTSAGTAALTQVTTDIQKYIPIRPETCVCYSWSCSGYWCCFCLYQDE